MSNTINLGEHLSLPY